MQSPADLDPVLVIFGTIRIEDPDEIFDENEIIAIVKFRFIDERLTGPITRKVDSRICQGPLEWNSIRLTRMWCRIRDIQKPSMVFEKLIFHVIFESDVRRGSSEDTKLWDQCRETGIEGNLVQILIVDMGDQVWSDP